METFQGMVFGFVFRLPMVQEVLSGQSAADQVLYEAAEDKARAEGVVLRGGTGAGGALGVAEDAAAVI